MPTPEQIKAAFDAWESEARKWVIREAHPWWLVEPQVDYAVGAETMTIDEVAFYKFNDKAAAQFFVRDKIIKAILTAAEAV